MANLLGLLLLQLLLRQFSVVEQHLGEWANVYEVEGHKDGDWLRQETDDVEGIVRARSGLVVFHSGECFSIWNGVIARAALRVFILDGPKLKASGRLSTGEIYICSYKQKRI